MTEEEFNRMMFGSNFSELAEIFFADDGPDEIEKHLPPHVAGKVRELADIFTDPETNGAYTVKQLSSGDPVKAFNGAVLLLCGGQNTIMQVILKRLTGRELDDFDKMVDEIMHHASLIALSLIIHQKDSSQ